MSLFNSDDSRMWILDNPTFILENRPVKSKILTKICAQIPNHHAAAFAPQTPPECGSPVSHRTYSVGFSYSI